MPDGKVHYEIYVQGLTAGAGWRLVDAQPLRDTAVKVAEALIGEGGLRAVKVVKETYNSDTGDYLSLTICELGDSAEVRNREVSDEATLPCFCPQDLYTTHARATMARLLSEYLGRHCLTVTELIHRADALETLTATGTVLQHAIQKVAVAHAGNTGQSVQDAVRKLNELVSKAVERVYKDARAGHFPKIRRGGLDLAYEMVAMTEEPDYLLCAAVADHLREAATWGDKLRIVLDLMDTLPKEGPGRDSCLGIVDRFVCDMVSGRAALQDLMGEHDSMGALLTRMTDLFLGCLDPDDPEIPAGVRALAVEFARGKLEGARGAIGQRILVELRAPRRLEPDCLETEVETVRGLATKMVRGQGKFLPIEDITDAFASRSRRLLASDVIEPFLEAIKSPPERIRRLLNLETNIVGLENKRSLAAILMPQITGHMTERHYMESGDSPVARLKEIAAFQTLVLQADFPDLNKRQLAEALDTLACEVESRAGLIEGICRRDTATENQIIALLRLVIGGVFAEGQMERRAKLAALRLIRQPVFSQTLVQGPPADVKKRDRFRELCDLIDMAELHKLSAAA